MKKNCWIWLDKALYPDNQKSAFTGNWNESCEDGTVVEFTKRIDFEKPIAYIKMIYSADALLQLWINEKFIGTGPVSVGGDFLANDRPRTHRYFTELHLISSGEDNHLESTLTAPGLDEGRVDVLARVRLCPVQINEFSMGQGGFMMSAEVHFEDGEVTELVSDESWDATVCPAYSEPGKYDGRRAKNSPTKPVSLEDIWQAEKSPLPLRVERRRLPLGNGAVTLAAGESRRILLEYDKIYAGYLSVNVKCEGEVRVSLKISETENDAVSKEESLIFIQSDSYLGTRMYSFGTVQAEITNSSVCEATVDIAINEAYLPASHNCIARTSDDGLNKILEVCRHTLKYCRQYIHLDSPKHCEPSACTGDYYIETMMTAFSFGDMTLAEFDAVRTANSLMHNDGEMFHPTYSLIFVRMLLDVYMHSGNIAVLEYCKEALGKLLSRFEGYVGELGIIDTPPNYMFVDWIYIDNISLHHPPKALGQTVMNMFYYDALSASVEIYSYLGEGAERDRCEKKRQELKKNINAHLYDSERGLYFEGMNTETPAELIYNYMPENVDKRYYRINSNALAVAFGVIEGEAAAALLRRVLDDPDFDDYQPYFAHFVLKAVHRAGLDGEYLLPILDKWRAPTEGCDKGLAEGFIPPEPTYSFDHSHAWGGTPLYSLPMALTSLEIREAGMSRMTVSPRLLGLDFAEVEIPTPKGVVRIFMKKGEQARIFCPEGVEVEVV